MTIVKVSGEAAQELEEAAVWYEGEQAGLGNRLIESFENAIQVLREPNPPLTPIQGKAASLGVKKLILHRFPFSLITVAFNQTMHSRSFCSSLQKACILVAAGLTDA